MEKSAEGAQVGGATLLIGKLFRKTNLALAEADKKGRHPTLIYINQVRSKVGVIYGNPETMPGGNAPKFQSQHHPARLRQERDGHEDQLDHAGEEGGQVRRQQVEVPDPVGLGDVLDGDAAARGPEGRPVRRLQHDQRVSEGVGQVREGTKKGWTILDEHYDTIEPFKTRDLRGRRRSGPRCAR